MKKIICIPYVDGRASDPVDIRLNADGSADLSALPAELRTHLQSYGVLDELRLNAIFPAEGLDFIERLLDLPFPTARFLPADRV